MAPLTRAAVVSQLRSALNCLRCGKSTIVVNVAGYRQRYTTERVTPATHCTCPGGPAACTTCGGHGAIDDPHHHAGDPFTPPTIPCPDPACTAALTAAVAELRCKSCGKPLPPGRIRYCEPCCERGIMLDEQKD